MIAPNRRLFYQRDVPRGRGIRQTNFFQGVNVMTNYLMVQPHDLSYSPAFLPTNRPDGTRNCGFVALYTAYNTNRSYGANFYFLSFLSTSRPDGTMDTVNEFFPRGKCDDKLLDGINTRPLLFAGFPTNQPSRWDEGLWFCRFIYGLQHQSFLRNEFFLSFFSYQPAVPMGRWTR